MPASQKRKERRENGETREPPLKKSKGGSGGKWQTPHQKEVAESKKRVEIEIGDAGIWATCARGQEKRALEELRGLLEDSAQRYYNIKSHPNGDDEDEEEEDIEKAIQKELSVTKTAPRVFEYVFLDLPCLLYFKVRPPIDPIDLVHRICEDVVKEAEGMRRMKYVNRLSPVSLIAKATEKGLAELCESVLGKVFELNEKEVGSGENVDGEGKKDEDVVDEEDVEKEEKSNSHASETDNGKSYPSYAIRPFIRAHTNLKRDVVIKQIASAISDKHKVDLTTPGKVIIVEIYQGFCGISVVEGDWDSLKRYNLSELCPKPEPVTSATTTAAAAAAATANN